MSQLLFTGLFVARWHLISHSWVCGDIYFLRFTFYFCSKDKEKYERGQYKLIISRIIYLCVRFKKKKKNYKSNRSMRLYSAYILDITLLQVGFPRKPYTILLLFFMCTRSNIIISSPNRTPSYNTRRNLHDIARSLAGKRKIVSHREINKYDLSRRGGKFACGYDSTARLMYIPCNIPHILYACVYKTGWACGSHTRRLTHTRSRPGLKNV